MYRASIHGVYKGAWSMDIARSNEQWSLDSGDKNGIMICRGWGAQRIITTGSRTWGALGYSEVERAVVACW